MNFNKSCFCWINPNWVDERLFEDNAEHAAAYKEIKKGGSFDTLKGHLRDFTFFPSKLDHTVRLLYLTKFEEEDPIVPFTLEQEKIMKMSAQADRTASGWLCIGGLLSIVTGTVIGALPAYWNIIPACVSTASGCLATGKYPDLSSNAANARQNIYNDQIKPMYKNMAYELIRLGEENPELAREIATHLPIERIRAAIALKLWPSGVDALVMPLKEAKKFVLLGKMPRRINSLRLYAENVLLKKQLYQNTLERVRMI